MSEKKNIVLRAPLITQSGYGVHARQVAKWLLKLRETRHDINVFFDIVPWGNTPWYVDPDACDGLIGEIFQNTAKPASYDVSLQLQLPNEWDPFLAKTNIGLTAAVETDRCSSEWVDAVNRMDAVIVPSEFTKRVFLNSGEVTTDISVVPESWLDEIKELNSSPNSLEEKLKLTTDFNFLIVSQFTGNNPNNDRKNIAYTIKWTLEQFKDNPEVGLIIKTNFGRQTKIDRKNALKALSDIIIECKRGPGPKVYLLHGHMTNKEILDLYTHPKVKAMLNLTHGEGFGLPLLEAATCGLPVIATNWSAHTEFLNQGKYIKVDCNIGAVHPSRVDNQIFVEGAQWAYPSEQDFKRKIKRFYSSPTIPKQWAQELKEKLLKSHSSEAIGKQYSEVLKEVI